LRFFQPASIRDIMLNRMIRCLFLLPVLLFAQPDTLPEGVAELEQARGVLDKKYIHITGDGAVGVSYAHARTLLDQPDLILAVEEAYAELLEEGEKPEFNINVIEPGVYQYKNKKGQETTIVELHREFTENGDLELVIYAEGKRSFGPFQALTYVHVGASVEDPDQSDWTVQVFAYPKNGFSRFFARNFGIAQRYFTKKTASMSELVTEICEHMVTASSEDVASVDSE